jgi:hypothetical protein
MSKLTVVFYGYCGKRSVFASQADADKAAEQYSREHGYTCEAFECSKHTAKSSGNPTMCWHVRAKTYPAMTREQWEQRAAEKRLIAEQEAASIQARRLQRVAEQEAVRAEAAEREAKILAAAAPKTLEVRHKAVSGKHGRRRKYSDGLACRQRWERDGKCKRCGKAKERFDRKNCNACLKTAQEYLAQRYAIAKALRVPVPKEVWRANLSAAQRAAWARRKKAEHGNR